MRRREGFIQKRWGNLHQSLHLLHLLIVCFVFCMSVYAEAITVGTAGEDFSTIQAAINAASDDDEIIVSEGTYVENIDFGGKNIVLRSTDPTNPTTVQNTVIDGNHVDSVVTFSGSESNQCVLSGFTIMNGDGDGGGVQGNFTSATIQFNHIRDNEAPGDGGGLWACGGIIQNNHIYRNSATTGGGFSSCDGVIQNNMIYENFASHIGGGFSSYSMGTPVYNNTVYGNSAGDWGGGYAGNPATFRNCIFWGNTAPDTPNISNMFDYMSYSCVEDLESIDYGNIMDDPKFVDPENGDFHLREDSPCIDAGGYVDTTTVDFENDERPWDATPTPLGDGSDFDIGADEYIPVIISAAREWALYR